jgi:hypothetical protein
MAEHLGVRLDNEKQENGKNGQSRHNDHLPTFAFSTYDNSGSASVSLRIVNPYPKAPYPKNGAEQKTRNQNSGHKHPKIRFQQVRRHSSNEYEHKYQS